MAGPLWEQNGCQKYQKSEGVGGISEGRNKRAVTFLGRNIPRGPETKKPWARKVGAEVLGPYETSSPGGKIAQFTFNNYFW